MAVPGIDGIHHLQIPAVRRGVLAYASGGLEVTKGLKMVRDVTPSFVEQIIVNRALFIDWHQLPQHALAEFETLSSNFNHRTTIHFEDVVHSVELGMVAAVGH